MIKRNEAMKIDEIKEDFVFPAYIHEKVIKEIIKTCKMSDLEIFGYLTGNILKWKEKTYIIIKDHLFIMGAVHSHQYSTAQIEGTAGKYEKKFQKLKQKKNDENLRIVGWWHSHPSFGVFLSTTDVATQEFFFPESFQVALVVDPVNNEYDFFTIDKNAKERYKSISFALISS